MTQRTLEDLASSFSLFDSWEDRYRYLIDLGERLTPMDEKLKIDENFVQGCTSRVWLVAGVKDGHFQFIADSDAKIVKGLIYLLTVAYQNKPLEEINKIDMQGVFERMGLHQNLSPNRRNGFFAMVERIRRLATVKAA